MILFKDEKSVENNKLVKNIFLLMKVVFLYIQDQDSIPQQYTKIGTKIQLFTIESIIRITENYSAKSF